MKIWEATIEEYENVLQTLNMKREADWEVLPVVRGELLPDGTINETSNQLFEPLANGDFEYFEIDWSELEEVMLNKENNAVVECSVYELVDGKRDFVDDLYIIIKEGQLFSVNMGENS